MLSAGWLHAGALHKPDIARYPAQAFIDVNVTGTLNVLLAARDEGVRETSLEALAKQGNVDRSFAARAIDHYRLLDVNAGTTGNAGGES